MQRWNTETASHWLYCQKLNKTIIPAMILSREMLVGGVDGRTESCSRGGNIQTAAEGKRSINAV